MSKKPIEVGDALPQTQFLIEDWPMKVFSLLMRDPNPVHFDPGYVERVGLGSRAINQGTLNMAYPLNVVLEWLRIEGLSPVVSQVDCRFKSSIYSGDTVVVTGEVTSVEDGSVVVLCLLARDDGEIALEMKVRITGVDASSLGQNADSMLS